LHFKIGNRRAGEAKFHGPIAVLFQRYADAMDKSKLLTLWDFGRSYFIPKLSFGKEPGLFAHYAN
jgi:hypothetical protein